MFKFARISRVTKFFKRSKTLKYIHETLEYLRFISHCRMSEEALSFPSIFMVLILAVVSRLLHELRVAWDVAILCAVEYIQG
jgi:hypothetical protein